ncbi:hypothetical protein O181_018525 [Austropuccinia psidii MF-1]|uniref:Uncharacterized protein n=1 Tax=Austropuccinia psidii MF-1 TaxID=1389203 RepID=A0A9Q3GU49_9BASI|nr:hypothetical protein [Austropuccinia psidii MF-1]
MLTLRWCPQDMPLMPPLPLLTPSPTRLILSDPYHPYANVVPSRHSYDPTLNATYPLHPPAALSPLLMLLHPRCLQSLCSRSTLKICLRCCPQPPLCLLPPAAYHPYAHILDP